MVSWWHKSPIIEVFQQIVSKLLTRTNAHALTWIASRRWAHNDDDETYDDDQTTAHLHRIDWCEKKTRHYSSLVCDGANYTDTDHRCAESQRHNTWTSETKRRLLAQLYTQASAYNCRLLGRWFAVVVVVVVVWRRAVNLDEQQQQQPGTRGAGGNLCN